MSGHGFYMLGSDYQTMVDILNELKSKGAVNIKGQDEIYKLNKDQRPGDMCICEECYGPPIMEMIEHLTIQAAYYKISKKCLGKIADLKNKVLIRNKDVATPRRGIPH